MIENKPVEYWAVVGGMALWVFTSTSQTESLPKRIAKTITSGVLAFGLSAEVANYLGVGEGPAAVAIMAFGLLVLDTATAIVGDRKFIEGLIRRRIGGNKE